MGFESLHAAAAEGDDQELRKRVEGLDVDRFMPAFCDFLRCRFYKILISCLFVEMACSTEAAQSLLSWLLSPPAAMADIINQLLSTLLEVSVIQLCIKLQRQDKQLQ